MMLLRPVPTVTSQDIDDDQFPYLDGFLRSFLLGLACGGVFETLHVLIKVRRRRVDAR